MAPTTHPSTSNPDLSARSPLLRGGALGRGVALVLLGASLAACGGAAPPALAPEQAFAPPAAPAAQVPGSAGMEESRDAERVAMAPMASPASMPPAPAPAPGRAAAAPGAPAAAQGAKTAPDDERTIAEAPMVVYQGELALRVDAGQGPEAIDAVVTLAESLGGHLAGRDDVRVVVKIPSRRFREAMTQVDAEFEVERRSVRAEDVTAEFKDLEVRLENLRATRKRLEQLMEKTGSLADTLTVAKELERVAGEIDRIQGRLRFLRTHTSFSTLTVAVAERAKSTPVVAAAPARAPRRDLSLPVAWVEQLGVDALVHIPADE